MEEIKDRFDKIFYKDENENFIPLFKENCKDEIINLFKEILESKDANSILKKINFLFDMINQCIDIAIIFETSSSLILKNEIGFIELLCDLYIKFSSENELKDQIVVILKFLINNITINPNLYYYIFRSIVNKNKNTSIDTFNNYIDILEILYPKIDNKEEIKKEKYFFFYNKAESGIQIISKISFNRGFAFKFWFYLEKYHKNENSNLIKITLGEDIYKLNLNGNKVDILINDEIQEGLDYKINYEDWNNIVFGITNTHSRNIILFSYKLEKEKKKTKIKAIPIEIESISLQSVIFFENFIGRVSSIILYNNNQNSVIDYFEDINFMLPNKDTFNNEFNKNIFSCFSPQTLDIERMEIEDPINHYQALFVKLNDFHLNYAHIIHKKIKNIYNYLGINIFYPIFDFIYENYNNNDGVNLFNRIFKIICLKIDEINEYERNRFFQIFSCFLKNYNRCFLEDNKLLNNFLYDNVNKFSVMTIKPHKKSPFLNDLLFNWKIMIKFSEEQQSKFWDFILNKLNEFYKIEQSRNNFVYLERFLDLKYLQSFFIYEFKKEFEIDNQKNFILVLRLILENDKLKKSDNNKDKFFFFRFLLNPEISFQKVEFILFLFYKYINEDVKFPSGQQKNIITYFIKKNFITDLLLFYARYPINIKVIVINIFRVLLLNYYQLINQINSNQKDDIIKIIDKFFLYEYNFFEQEEKKEDKNQNKDEMKEDEINTNLINNNQNEENNIKAQEDDNIILKMDSEDNTLFLIIDIFHLIFRCIFHEWTNDNLIFEYQKKEDIDLDKVNSIIKMSFENLCTLIQNNNLVSNELFLQNNFLKIFGKIYFDNFFLINKNNENINKIIELIDKKGKDIFQKLNNEIISNKKIIPFYYISYLINYNYKLFQDKEFEQSCEFFKYFYENIKNDEKINNYENETNNNFKMLLNYADINNYNYLVDDRIFTISISQISKFTEYLKKRDNFLYSHICNNLKKKGETLIYLFDYPIHLIYEGFIRGNLKKINEYFIFIQTLILCDIQNKFEEKEIIENIEKCYDFFFVNFFTFYYLNINRKKDYIKIFANILRIAKLIREIYALNGMFKTYIQKDARIIKVLEKFKIFEINQESNKNCNFNLSELNNIFSQSDDDLNSILKKKLEEQKNIYLTIINDLYDRNKNINLNTNYNQNVNVEEMIKHRYRERRKNFIEEYLFAKNKQEYIYSYKNKKKYRKLKKLLYSYNQPYSNFNTFYTKEGKNKLKFKISNHLTKQYTHPLLVPILDIKYYLPKEFTLNLFKDQLNNSYQINLHSFSNEEQLNFINDKNYKKCCLVKITNHIIGFMNYEKDKIEFFSKKLLQTDRGNDPHYNLNKNKCFGTLLETYHQNEDYYLKIKKDNIKYAIKRTYYYTKTGFEIYTYDNKNYFFVFQDENYSNQLFSLINKRGLQYEDIYTKWSIQNKISNFEFIMYLNIFGNRSFRDITQYPVFPWIIPEKTLSLKINKELKNSIKFSLSEFNNSRDLQYPMGLIEVDSKSKLRKESYMSNYQSMILDISTIKSFKYEDESLYETNNFFDWEKIPFCFGSHYSNQVYVSHYLTRLFPFTLTALEIQKWEFDLPERLFFNFENSYNNSIREKSDVRELIPEFFYLPDIFNNINNLNLGFYINETDRSKIEINDVILPEWSKNKSDILIYVLKEMLEETNKEQIFKWIDLIFGEYQFGNLASEKFNVFLPYAYNYWGFKKLKKLSHDESSSDIKHYFELGICPHQFFRSIPQKKNSKKKSIVVIEKENILDLLTCQIEFKRVNCSEDINSVKCIIFNKVNNSIQYIKSNQIIEKDLNNIFISQINLKKITSYKKLFCNCVQDKYIITGFYNGEVLVYGNNNYFEEIRMKNTIITSRDKSMISALEINKKTTLLFLGTIKGSIIIYNIKKNNLNEKRKDIFTYSKMIHNNCKRINYICSNDNLKMFISCAEDGFINLYLMNSYDLVGSVFDKIKCDYVFLFNTPIPSFSTFSNSTCKFNCYTLNGNSIDLKDFDEENKIIEYQNEKIFNPIIVTNKFRDFLIYLSDKREIVIRRAPYMENIKNIAIKDENVLLTSIKEGNNNIYIVIFSNGSIQIYTIIPKVI